MFGENEFGFKLYSNQYIPLIEDALIPENPAHRAIPRYSQRGGILHINMQDQIKDPADMKHLIEYSVKNGVSHFAVNYGFGKMRKMVILPSVETLISAHLWGTNNRPLYSNCWVFHTCR